MHENSDAWLAEIQARADAAWALELGPSNPHRDDVQLFAAHARADLQMLVAEVRRLGGLLDNLTTAAAPIVAGHDCIAARHELRVALVAAQAPKDGNE